MTRELPCSRRDFLKTSVAVAGAAALGPRAYARVLGANERIHFGVIGLGVMGSGHLQGMKEQQQKLNIDVLQTCDVYRKRPEQAAQVIGAPANPTQRHEEVLGNPKFDAVLIATPAIRRSTAPIWSRPSAIPRCRCIAL